MQMRTWQQVSVGQAKQAACMHSRTLTAEAQGSRFPPKSMQESGPHLSIGCLLSKLALQHSLGEWQLCGCSHLLRSRPSLQRSSSSQRDDPAAALCLQTCFRSSQVYSLLSSRPLSLQGVASQQASICCAEQLTSSRSLHRPLQYVTC